METAARENEMKISKNREFWIGIAGAPIAIVAYEITLWLWSLLKGG